MSDTASENHVVAIPNGSMGVVVYFEGTSYRFGKEPPRVDSYREKAILRALLDVAIENLDAS